MAGERGGDVVVSPPPTLGAHPLSQTDPMGGRQTWTVRPKGSLLGNKSIVIW